MVAAAWIWRRRWQREDAGRGVCRGRDVGDDIEGKIQVERRVDREDDWLERSRVGVEMMAECPLDIVAANL